MKKISLSIPVSIVIVFALAALPVSAQEASHDASGQPPEDMAKAIRLHNAGRQGDQEALKQANGLLKMMVKNEPKNALANAYFGSTYAVMGRDAESLVNKIRYVNRGLRYLDEALHLAPDDFVVRFIRANVNSSLPEMFSRADKATEDMLVLHRIYQPNPTTARATMMINVYKKLIKRTPETDAWSEHLKQARITSGE